MKFSRTISTFLPGIFLVGFNIGTGSVTAMTKAGATYGLSLLWTVLLSCLVTYFMIVTYGRFTLISGETAIYAFRKHIHPFVAWFFVVVLTMAVSGSVMGVMGIIANVSSEWSKGWIQGGISPIYFAIFFICSVYAVFWNGKTQFFEKAMAVIVGVMIGSFVLSFFLLMPSPGEILQGMVPNIPEVPSGRSQGPFLVIASMVGTTVFSGLFIIRTTLVKEAGWVEKDLKTQKYDAMLSAAMMFLISFAIMATAASTLHVEGLNLNRVSEMLGLLKPVAGTFAVSIFATGIVAAGLSSQLPNVLMLPWLLCDYQQVPCDLTATHHRIMTFFISLLGLVVPIFKAPPVMVMIVSQAFTALILPATVLSILYLGNVKEVMGNRSNDWRKNAILVLILLFSILISGSGIKGLMGAL